MKKISDIKIYAFKKGAGTVKRFFDEEGEIESEKLIANFATRITKQITIKSLDKDDQIELCLDNKLFNNSKLKTIKIKSADFENLNWILSDLGVTPYLEDSSNPKKEYVKSIRQFSHNMTQPTTYNYAGYAKVNDKLAYLSQGTVITDDDFSEDITVDLKSPILKDFSLPKPTDDRSELIASIKHTNKLLNISNKKPSIGAALIASTFLPLLNLNDEIEFSIFIVGHTGAYKTGTAALVQKHFGENFSRKNLPGNWLSTEHSMPMALQIVNNAVIVYDDFKYDSPTDIKSKNKSLDRLVRNVANSSTRQRKPEFNSAEFNRKPASIPIITAENIPIDTGNSLIPRMILVDIEKGDVKLDDLKKLSHSFNVGSFSQTTASFIKFSINNQPKIHAQYKKIKDKYINIINKNIPISHDRLAPNFASLIATLSIYRCFIVKSKAMSKSDSKKLYNKYKNAILDLALKQREIETTFNMSTALKAMFIQSISQEQFEYRSLKTDEPINMNHLYGKTMPNKPAGNNNIIWIDNKTQDVFINSLFNIKCLLKYFNGNCVVNAPTGEKSFWKFIKKSGGLKSFDLSRNKNNTRKTIKGCGYTMYHTNFIIPKK